MTMAARHSSSQTKERREGKRRGVFASSLSPRPPRSPRSATTAKRGGRRRWRRSETATAAEAAEAAAATAEARDDADDDGDGAKQRWRREGKAETAAVAREGEGETREEGMRAEAARVWASACRFAKKPLNFHILERRPNSRFFSPNRIPGSTKGLNVKIQLSRGGQN